MASKLFAGRRVMWMPLNVGWQPPSPNAAFCCEAMTAALAFDCDQHGDPFACADHILVYNEVFDEIGIVVHDGGASDVLIARCPWCGSELTQSQRDRWFDETEEKGFMDSELPEAYRSGAWRRLEP